MKRSVNVSRSLRCSKTFARTSKDEDIPNFETSNGSIHFYLEILKKLDLVVEQQNQKRQTDQLENLNKNLQKLMEGFAVKFPQFFFML